MLLRNNQTYIVIHIPQVFIVNDEIFIHIRTDHVAVMITLVDQVDDMSADDTYVLHVLFNKWDIRQKSAQRIPPSVLVDVLVLRF